MPRPKPRTGPLAATDTDDHRSGRFAGGRAGRRGKIRKQAVEAVTRHVTLRLTGSLAADEKSDVGSNATGIVSRPAWSAGAS